MIKFLTIQIPLCARFCISFPDNAYLTAVAGLQCLESNGFWAVAPNKDYCEALSISERTLQNMSKELENKGLLIRGSGTRKRASNEFCEALLLLKTGGENLAPPQELHPKGAESAPQKVQILHPKGAESAPNKEIKESSYKEKINTDFPSNDLPLAVIENRRKAQQQAVTVPPPFDSDKAKESWATWVWYLFEKGKNPTRTTLEAHARELRNHSESTALGMIEQAIRQGWVSPYPLQEKKESKPSNGKKSTVTDWSNIAPNI